MRSFFLFFFILISLDFIFSQLFLLDILYKKELLTFKNDITYRVPDKEFKYSLKKILNLRPDIIMALLI